VVNRIREFSYKYPAATAVIAFVVIGLAFFRIVQTSQQRNTPAAPAASRAAAPGVTPTTPAATVPAPAAPPASGVPLPPGVGGHAATPPAGSPGANAAPPAPTSGQAAPGRADPFEAPTGYVFVGGTPTKPTAGTRPGGSGFGLPPVPPLPPSGGGVGTGTTASAPAGPQYRLTGVMGGPTAVAILEDKGGTHIATSGDVLAPGVRVVGIDAVHGVVTLNEYGAIVEVRLAVPALQRE